MLGKANGAPPVFTGSSGFDSHPEIFCNLKNFEGGSRVTVLPSIGGIRHAQKT